MDHHEERAAEPSRRPTRRGMRSGIFAAGAAFGITLAGLGIAGAQTSTAPSDPAPAEARAAHPERRHHLDAAAKAIGISEAELLAALRGGQSIAQVAQSRGVAVQAVIDAVVAGAQQGLVDRVTALVNRNGLPEGGHGHGHRVAPLGAGLDEAAEAIGITRAELAAALRGGQSIAQVAQSKGVAVQAVLDALVAGARERLAARVAAGELTQAKADDRAADLVEQMTDLVNRTGGRGRGGPGR